MLILLQHSAVFYIPVLSLLYRRSCGIWATRLMQGAFLFKVRSLFLYKMEFLETNCLLLCRCYFVILMSQRKSLRERIFFYKAFLFA